MLEMRPVYDEVYAHAMREHPREACGLFVRTTPKGALRYWPCRNVAPEGAARDSFQIDPRDWMAAEAAGTIEAVVHSHPDASAEPSSSDRAMCQRMGIAWYVMAVPDGTVKRIDPAPLPYLGREFFHGVVDCYTLMQDYYSRELGATLPDFERADEWWAKGGNLYVDNFARAGFVHVGHPHVVQPLQHDAVLVAVKSDVPNHALVYLGDGTVMHHLYGRPSCTDVWGGYWQRHGTHVLRHRSLVRNPDA